MTAYALGVDLGTTYAAAAIGRGAEVTTLQLGAETATVPSVVVVRHDGEILLGDAAERRSASEPTRTAREFKRRLGDPVPILLGDDSYPVERLMALQLADIVRRATEQEGEPPTTVVLTHPANYTSFKLGKLREVAALAGLDANAVTLLPEPEAAAVAYSRARHVEPGELVAVYDFGGGTFDAALIARTEHGFELTGVPEGMERLGGIDFDEAVLAHVDRAVSGGLAAAADDPDPRTLPSLAQLRVECRRAKEALSADVDTTIPVALPALRADVRLTRAEFETMIRPRVAQTIEALERTIASSGLGTSDVSRVLLVGGSSRIPLVAEMITAATGRPVSVDVHPKLTIASGAALVGAAANSPPVRTAPPTEVVEWRAPTRADAGPAEPRRKRPSVAVIGVGVAVIVAIAVAAIAVLTRSGDDLQTTSTSEPPAEPATTGTDAEPPASEAPTSTSTSSSADPADPPPPSATVVATLDAEPRTMSGSAVGAMVVSTTSGDVLSVTDDGTARSVAAVPDDIGEYGGLTATPDNRYLASTPAGVVDLATGDLVVDGAAAGLGSTPGPVATDGLGNIYVADNDARRIVRQGIDGTLSLVAGNGGSPSGGDDGRPAFTVGIGAVRTITIDTVGRLVFFEDGAIQARMVDADGAIQQAAHVPRLPSDVATFAVDSLGRLWTADGRRVSILPGG